MIDVVKGTWYWTDSRQFRWPSLPGVTLDFAKLRPKIPRSTGTISVNASERHIDRDESCGYSTAVCRRSNTAGFLCVTSCATGKHYQCQICKSFPRRSTSLCKCHDGFGCRMSPSLVDNLNISCYSILILRYKDGQCRQPMG